MRIVHICCGALLEGGDYQEQDLARQNLRDGHEVIIITTNENILPDGKISYTKKNTFKNTDGVNIYRLKFFRFLGYFIARRLLYRFGLMDIIRTFKPDIIYHHGISLDLIRVSRYISKYKKVKLFVDSHADYNNSAHYFLTKYIIHKFIYKLILMYAMERINKFFYITLETKIFAIENYNIKESQMDYLPLGSTNINYKGISSHRHEIRKSLNIKDSDILLLHSGKFDYKKRTIETVMAFKRFNNINFKLLIIGKVSDEIREEFYECISNSSNLIFLGWMSTAELDKYLQAADLYLQPGSQSITMQRAICAGCAMALYPYISHDFLLEDAYFKIKSDEDIFNLLNIINNDRSILYKMKEKGKKICINLLDYSKTIKKMYV